VTQAIRRRAVHDVQWHEVDAFPDLRQIEHGELFALRLTNNTNTLTHGLHRFPAKFIPQVPAWAIEQFGRGGHVLDPFMGSGTTLVEGLVAGAKCTGIDIDPLARFISMAKVGGAEPGELKEACKEIHDRWRAPARRVVPPMPDISNFSHWYSLESWGWLQSLLEVMVGLQCSTETRHFLLTVFSSILRRVSFADDQSQKTYVSGTLRKSPPDPRITLWRALGKASKALDELVSKRSPTGRARVVPKGDACEIPLTSGSVDLIVTSPPYMDSVDYMYNMMLEYFWLGPLLGVPTRKSFNRLRRAQIGAKNPLEPPSVEPSLIDLLSDAGLSPSRRRAALAYFAAMGHHFLEASRCLQLDGRYVLIIGNSATRRGLVPVHEALVRLAGVSGLVVEKVFGYRLRRHYMKFPRSGRGGIILLDWVIVFRKARSASNGVLPLPRPWLTIQPSAVAN
jgi:hypothetical protein